MSGRRDDTQDETCSRREVLAALAKYSAVVGGAATTIVTADGLVSAASAYWSAEKWEKFCAQNPTHWKCADRITSASSSIASRRIDF